MLKGPWMSRRARILLTGFASCSLVATLTSALPAGAQGTPLPTQTLFGPATGSLSILRSASQVRAGQVLTLTGQLRSGGVPRPGVTVLLRARTGGTATVRTQARLLTDRTGRLSVSFHPRLTTEYRFAFAGDSITSAVRSGTTATRVVPVADIRISRNSAGSGDPVTVTGQLRPALEAAPVLLQRRIGNQRWHDVARGRSTTNGAVTIAWRAGRPGPQSLRLRLPAHASYQPAVSQAVPLAVAADLAVGDRGRRVVGLQRRLARLHYDVGAIDGVFGSSTLHALLAFQKSQRLPRSGVADVRTRHRLADPHALTVRYPSAGRAIEIDLARQILIMSESGRITRIVDVSTGNNEYYFSDGNRYRATTPIGRFRIQRKIDGVRVARLGKLYRPAYFVGGWAIHGSSSVPNYPASHGCVRVTNATMDRIFDLLTVGTPVAVYPR